MSFLIQPGQQVTIDGQLWTVVEVNAWGAIVVGYWST